jgi:hypothetical protein
LQLGWQVGSASRGGGNIEDTDLAISAGDAEAPSVKFDVGDVRLEQMACDAASFVNDLVCRLADYPRARHSSMDDAGTAASRGLMGNGSKRVAVSPALR